MKPASLPTVIEGSRFLLEQARRLTPEHVRRLVAAEGLAASEADHRLLYAKLFGQRLSRFAFRQTVSRQSARTTRPGASACLVLLSWCRPFNIGPIVRNALASGCIEHVLISNNNTKVDLRRWLKTRDPRITIFDQPKDTKQGIRLPLSAASTHDYVLWIDDDVFLAPEQVKKLLEAAAREPERAHGIRGERFDDGTPIGRPLAGYPYRVYLSQRETSEVDHLTNVYCFRRDVGLRAMAICARVGIEDFGGFGNGEDIVLSRGGAEKPRLHDVGPVLTCPSAFDADIATFMKSSFVRERLDLLEALAALEAARGAALRSESA